MNGYIPIDFLPDDIRIEVINRCESTACKDSKNELVRIRNDISATCAQADTAKSQRDAYAAVAAVLLTAAAGAAVAGVKTPWPFNLVLFIIASVLLTLGLIFAALAANRQNLWANLMTAISIKQSDFQSAVSRMLIECPQQCRGDTTLPTCKGGGS